MSECKSAKNTARCNCSYEPCSRKGVCCDCLAYHWRNRELPACLFPAQEGLRVETDDETLAAAVEEAGTAHGVRCILIAGAPDVFCAGNDLNDFVTMARSGGLGAPIIRFLHALARCQKPMVAAVSGALLECLRGRGTWVPPGPSKYATGQRL